MPFEKGNSLGGRKEGSIGQKTKQWEALAESIATTHTERFNEILAKLPEDKFISSYLQILEYFKPKLARNTTDTNISFSKPVVLDWSDESGSDSNTTNTKAEGSEKTS